MKQFVSIIFALIVAANAASTGYKYQQPQRQQPQPIRPALPQSNNGIYSGVQAPPLAPPQFSQPAPAAISLPAPPPPAPPLSLPAPHEIALPAPAPAPISVPQQQYLPPQQHQQSFSQQQFQQQYQQQQQSLGGGVSSFSQGQQFSQPIQGGGFQQQGGGGGFQQQSGGFQQQGGGFQQQGGGFQQQNFQSFQRPQTAIITKDIFIHSAPEDNGSDGDQFPQLDNGPVRKNYRIVFIKAPHQNLRGAAAALKRAQAQHEEKTIIYVLSKKPDLSEVSQQLQQAQGEQKVNKPEVFFIKYKTQEEANRAQQEIQAQYDALGGSTHISDEGVAPITTIGNGALNLGSPIGGGASGSAILSGQIGGGIGGGSFSQGGGSFSQGGGSFSQGGGSFSQGGIQQQSFSQQSFQTSQGGSGISQKYLPVKAFKK